jgi:hypothetical protein
MNLSQSPVNMSVVDLEAKVAELEQPGPWTLELIAILKRELKWNKERWACIKELEILEPGNPWETDECDTTPDDTVSGSDDGDEIDPIVLSDSLVGLTIAPITSPVVAED